MNADKIHEISNRYMELYEQITGLKFVKGETNNILQRIDENVKRYLLRV